MIDNITLAGCIDTTALVLILVFCIAGSVRGLAGECGRFLALAAGIAVTLFLYPALKTHVFTQPELPWRLLAMAGAVVAAALVALIVNVLTRKFLSIIVGQPADAIFGALVAVFSTAGTIVILFFFLHSLPDGPLRSALFDESITGRIAEPLIRHAQDRMAWL